MKKFVFILFFLNFLTLYSKESLFEFERFSTNFNGVAHNQNSLIVYGESGVLLKSSDKGKTWKQKNVDKNELSINKIVRNGNDYYGILSKDFIIQSKDDGENWTKVKPESNVSFNDLALNDEFLFVLSDSSVLLYDYSFNKVKSINFYSTTKASAILELDNHLFVSSDSGKLIDFDISDGFKQRTIDFNELALCNGCTNPSQLKTESSKIYLTLGSDLILSTDKGITWSKADNGVSCYTIRNSACYSLVSNFDYFRNISFPMFYKSSLGKKERINSDYISRYVYTMFYNSLEFISDDTLIAVGNDKLIIMSQNGGKNWEYISNIRTTATGSFWLNSDTGFVFYEKGQVFRTTDGGITFLPQFWEDNTYLPFKYFTALYFNSSGEGIVFYPNNKNNGLNFLLTKDFGETFKDVSVSSLIGTIGENVPKIASIDSNFVFFFPTYGGRNHKTLIYLFDKNLNQKKLTILDSISIVLMKVNKDNNEIIAIGYERRYPKSNSTYDSVNFYLMSSVDYGSSWSKNFKFKLDNNFFVISEVDEKYYITTTRDDSTYNASVFLNIFNPINKSLIEYIYIGNNIIGSNFFKLGERLLISGYDRVFYNDNYIEEPSAWSSDSIYIYKLAGTSRYGNNIAYVVGMGNNHQLRLLKMTQKNSTEVGEIQILRTYLYNEKPYPIPASNKVSCKIYWDLRYDINNANFEVYDISGNIIKSTSTMIFNRKDIFSGEINWDCSSIQDGIYYISFTHGDARNIIPIIISR